MNCFAKKYECFLFTKLFLKRLHISLVSENKTLITFLQSMAVVRPPHLCAMCSAQQFTLLYILAVNGSTVRPPHLCAMCSAHQFTLLYILAVNGSTVHKPSPITLMSFKRLTFKISNNNLLFNHIKNLNILFNCSKLLIMALEVKYSSITCLTELG